MRTKRKQGHITHADGFSGHELTEDEEKYVDTHRKHNSFRGFCSVCHNPVYFEISNWTTTDGCPAHKKCLDNYLIDTENGPFVAICRRKDCNYVFYGEDHELIKLHADDHYLKRHNLPYGPYQEYPIGHETFLLLDKPGGKSGRKARHQLIENIKEIYGQEIGTS